jgi:hypothetical protein
MFLSPLFRKKTVPIPLEQQLQTLAACGVVLAPEATLEDLYVFHTRQEHEAAPYQELIPTLGFSMERDNFSPLCHRLWMCDYECIDGDGSYVEVIERLHLMSGGSLPISAITDHVDLEEETAWVEFDLGGTRVHWDAKVDNDWLDPYIIVKFDQLLRINTSPFHIYSNHRDFGQSAFLACFTPGEFQKFQKLAKFKLLETVRQT